MLTSFHGSRNKLYVSLSSTESKVMEPPLIRWLLLSVALLFLGIILIFPLIVVFQTAFRNGIEAYFEAITHHETLFSLKLTLICVVIAVPLNTIFGLAAAWAITRFEFKGKRYLVSAIDIPFAVSPVISGMIFILLFGSRSVLGDWLLQHDIRIVFAVPGLVIATTFVTFPFVARELIPVLQLHGENQELAAMTLGASPWQTFFYVTLPGIKWGLFYGSVLCAARAIGEFGAVSVVSGHIRGETNTVPLHIEILYNEYQFSAAFAVSSLLVLVAILTLVIKTMAQWYGSHKRKQKEFK